MSSKIKLYVYPGGVDAVVDGDRDSFRTIPVDKSIDKDMQIVEEAVYSTPSLITDYNAVDVVVASDDFMIVPESVADNSDLLLSTFSNLWPDTVLSDISVIPCFGAYALAMVNDRQLSGFVSRTFPNSRIVNRMAVLINFFASMSRPVNRVKIYANIAEDFTLDIVALTSDSLLLANTYHCNEIDDVFYFIMAAVKDTGFDALDDELLIYGHQPHCQSLTENLRKYINSVMPLLLTESQKSIPLELQYENNQR